MQALILDNNLDDRALLIDQLRRGGFTTVAVASIRQARETLEQQPFDLLLMEVELPDGDGLRFCNELREHLGDGLIIIFVTRRDDSRRRVVGIELGADDFMCKPCNGDELLMRIEARLRRRPKSVNLPPR